MYRGCETLFRAITLNIIFYLPANYRISFSACRPVRPCSPHFGEARGMVPSLTRLCLICSYIFTWHLPSKNRSLLFPPLFAYCLPHISAPSHPGTCCSPVAVTHPCVHTHPSKWESGAGERQQGSALLWAARAWLQVLSQSSAPSARAPGGLCTT